MLKNLLLATVLLLTACGHPEGPKPLTLEEIPAALTQAFQSANLLVRQNADSIGKLIQEKQFAVATIQLQTFLSQELSDPQRQVVSAAFQTLNQILQQQAASVEPSANPAPEGTPAKPETSKEEAAAAAAVLDHYTRTK